MSWMATKNFSVDFSYVLDEASLLMGLIVTGVGGLIHIYSIGYMHGDKGYYKFFMYLNLRIEGIAEYLVGGSWKNTRSLYDAYCCFVT